MQSLVLPGCSTLHSSFKTHRSQADRSGSMLRLNLADPTPTPYWASLPSPPMSGSPPQRDPLEPQQIAGHRRKRSDSPPHTSPPPPPPSPPVLISESTPQAGVPGPGRELALAADRQVQQAPYYPPYASTHSYGYGSSLPSVTGSSAIHEPQVGYTQISPRATRKVKAHVASACVNCKKKHLRCDTARPCQRCVQSGKESTCYDVEHRKRGRPPLKPEDPSARSSFDQGQGGLPPPTARRGSQPAIGFQGQSATSSWRDIRPILSRGLSDSGRSLYRPGPSFPSIYAPPTIAASASTAMGTMIPSERSSYRTPSAQPPQPYAMEGSTSYGATNYESSQHSHMQSRSYPPYLSQPQYAPPAQPVYPYTIFPRTTVQPIPEEGPVGLYGSSSLQLPPIRPAPHGRAMEPAMAQQQLRQTQQQPGQQYREGQGAEQGSSDQPDAKRPRMDIRGILDPRND